MDLSTTTGLAATEKARRRVVKRVAGNMVDGVGQLLEFREFDGGKEDIPSPFYKLESRSEPHGYQSPDAADIAHWLHIHGMPRVSHCT